jgi:hypothetical protein
MMFVPVVSRYGPSTGKKMATFLSTGNVVSSTGLDLMQVCTTYTLASCTTTLTSASSGY